MKLIYWPHSRSKVHVTEMIQIQTPYWPCKITHEMQRKAEEMAREINELADIPEIFTEAQFERVKDRRLRERPDIKHCYKLRLGRHSVYEPIPVFEGFTPRYDFDREGFKKEGGIDLLEDIDLEDKNVEDWMKIDGLVKMREDTLPEAMALAGTDKAYQQKRLKIEQEFNRLNADRIPFVVFRSWRGFPPWDNIRFYSLGRFKTE